MNSIVIKGVTILVLAGIAFAGYFVGKSYANPVIKASNAGDNSGVRLDYKKVAPDAYQAMLGMENYVRQSGVEKSLLELIRIRSSQLNSCAHCLDMHLSDANSSGETAERLGAIEAWHNSTLFSSREKAALAWAEALTLISQKPISDDLFDATRKYFTDSELVAITMATISINGWNRLNVGFLSSPQSCPVQP